MSDGGSRQRPKILKIEQGIMRFRFVNELKRAILAAIRNEELKDGDYFAFNIRQEKVFWLEKEHYEDESGFSKQAWVIYDAMTGAGEYLTDPGRRVEDIAIAPFVSAMSMYEAAGKFVSGIGDRIEQEKQRLQQQRDALQNWDRDFTE